MIRVFSILGLTLILFSCASQNHIVTNNMEHTTQYSGKTLVGIKKIDIVGFRGFIKYGELMVAALFGPAAMSAMQSSSDSDSMEAFLQKNNIDVIKMFETEFTYGINQSVNFQNAGTGKPRYILDITFSQLNFVSTWFRNKYFPAIEIIFEVEDTKTSEFYTDIFVKLSTYDSSYPILSKQEWLSQPALIRDTYKKMISQMSKKAIYELSNLEEYKEYED